MTYRITYVGSVAKTLRKLDRQNAHRILRAIGNLADNPRPSGCIALQGGDGELRIRVGNYRIVYDVIDDELVILILRVGHRREVYR
ncbi:MAG: type II toxin-antitoxin system RelE family toxin [Leucobacter sp.]